MIDRKITANKLKGVSTQFIEILDNMEITIQMNLRITRVRMPDEKKQGIL
jgi:hypothetical protein